MQLVDLNAFCLACLFVLATLGLGQSYTLQISDHAKDSSGAVIPAAEVTLTNQTTGLDSEVRIGSPIPGGSE